MANCSVAGSNGKSRFRRAATSAGGVTPDPSPPPPSRTRIEDGSDGGERRRLSVTDRRADATPWPLTSRTYSPTLPPPSGTTFRPSPAEVAARLNRLFPFDPATEQFATLVYGVLDAATGEFRYASAGHPGPVHLSAGADPVVLESRGSPIGLADDAYEERSVRLGAGDRLYLYSDGVPEAMDPAGEPFGEARLLAAITRARSEPLIVGTNALLEEVVRWHGPGSPHDDISLLAVEVFAASAPPGPEPSPA